MSVSAPDGAQRVDPDRQKFTEYTTITQTANGTGVTYGAAAGRNGYWATMIHPVPQQAFAPAVIL